MIRSITLFLLFVYIALTSAQVNVIYTPIGGIAVGSTVLIQWNYTTMPTQPGTLNIVNNANSKATLINGDLNLTPKEYNWSVNVPAGIYYFTLNDGSGDQFSGTFVVYVPGSTTPVLSTSATKKTTKTTSNSKALSITSNSASLIVQVTVSTASPTKSESQPAKSSGSASAATVTSIPGCNLLFNLFVVAAAMIKFA